MANYCLLLLGITAAVRGVRRDGTIRQKVINDIGTEAHIFQSTEFPTLKLAPSVGNGHLATNVFSDTVYMNGLYNGNATDSRRARIPSWANIRLKSTLGEYYSTNASLVYSLDTKTGVFAVQVNSEHFLVTHRIYAHSFYTRAIVNQIEIESKLQQYDLNRFDQTEIVELVYDQGLPSTDITFSDPVSVNLDGTFVFSTCGQTLISENVKYQPNPSEVCVYWTIVPRELMVPKLGCETHTFIMVADPNQDVALNEISGMLRERPEELYKKHVEEWEQRHEVGNIIVEGDLELSKAINGAWYYLLSSLPSFSSNQPHNSFYGLSPGSLARGGYDNRTDTYEGYRGHNFWDTETWMLPPVMLLYPDLAKALLGYRLETANVSAENAKEFGFKGIRYAWESAFTGMEGSPANETAIYEQHITGCISFAIRQYYAITRDESFLQNGGCKAARKIAEFWASRVTYNTDTGFYDINNVMGPDEYYANINNSIFTNVVAGYSLYLGRYLSCHCSPSENIEGEELWEKIARKIAYPYDAINDYHPEYSTYERSYSVKQADAILLGFPLQYPMNQSTMINNLIHYETVTDPAGPAMSWGMFAIGFLQNDFKELADDLFRKGYAIYINEPFKVWSENNKDMEDIGAVNFITGMGGFLQSLTFGYAGIRIHLDRIEIIKPQLPPNTTKLTIKGIAYLGAKLNLNITGSGVAMVEVVSINNQWPLDLYSNGGKISLVEGSKVILLGGGPFIVKTANTAHDNCPLPLDLIGQVD